MDPHWRKDWRVIDCLAPDTQIGLYTGIVDAGLCSAMFDYCGQRPNFALVSLFALCLCQGCRGLDVWPVGGENGQNASGFSVPLVLLLTETGVAQDGASEGATPAPNTDHEDDNSLGYTGIAAFQWNFILTSLSAQNVFWFLFASLPDLQSSELCAVPEKAVFSVLHV